MSVLIQQAVLALGTGALVALAGLGVVQIYRGSGVLNFAHGAFALVSAHLVAGSWHDWGWPWPVALLIGVGAGALLGSLTHLVVMRPLRDASQLVRIVATVGVLQVVQQATLLIFGSSPRIVGSFLPQGSVEVGSVKVALSTLTLLAVVAVVTVLLAVVMAGTRFGLATQAVAHSEVIARSLGHDPDRIAVSSWAVGGGLAGLAGGLMVPIGGVTVQSILLLAVPAFAAAVLGGFRGYASTALAALVIAAAQGVFTYQSVARGWPPSLAPSLPFVVVVVVLVLRSASLPARDHVAPRLPRLGLRRPPWWVGLGALGATSFALVVSADLANALITSSVMAIVGLSLVICTGLTGQISLAQFAIGGLGALVAARTSDLWGWPFAASAALGVGAAAVAGALVALPASRTRGPALAVVTLGLGLAVQQGVLSDIDITGGFNGSTPVERPSVLGIDINASDHPQRYATLCLLAVVVVAIAVASLAESPLGRRFIAVRSNERAAAASGIRVGAAKVAAFAMSSAVAGVGGVLMAFRYDTVAYSQFSFAASLQVVTFVLIGGIGFVLGPVVGAIAAPQGLLQWAAGGLGDLERWLVMGAGSLLVVTLVAAPDGIVGLLSRRRSRARPTDEVAQPPAHWPQAALVVRDLRVRFGMVRAVDGVSLDVQPGRVTGLIGANGAGKTTVIDAISGLVPIESGQILLGGQPLHRLPADERVRLGVSRSFQSIEMFRDLSVRENLLVGTERPSILGWARAVVRPARCSLPGHLVWVAERLGLAGVLDASPEQLSHGQRRVVGVARALSVRPAVVLLDEPAAGLDRAETQILGEVIRTLADWGLGVLLVEHDVDLVLQVSDHVVVLDGGQPIYDGGPDGVLTDPNVKRSYLGESEPEVDTAGLSREVSAT